MERFILQKTVDCQSTPQYTNNVIRKSRVGRVFTADNLVSSQNSEEAVCAYA